MSFFEEGERKRLIVRRERDYGEEERVVRFERVYGEEERVF